MSDKPISVGDLVMIVGCLDPTMKHHLGKIGKALGKSQNFTDSWFIDGATRTIYGTSCSWKSRHLKRLDPGDLSEDVPTSEELPA